MKEILKLGVILFLFCAIGSAILAYVNELTKAKIAENKKQTEGNARSEVLPDGKFDGPFIANAGSPDSLLYYSSKDASGKVSSYTFVAAGRGYSSTIKTMVAVTSDFQISKIKVIEQNETPGLGANCVNADFPPRFEKLRIEDLAVDKDGGKIKSISGSTISTRAIIKSIRKSLQILKNEIEKKPQTNLPADDPIVEVKAAPKPNVNEDAARAAVMPNVKFEGPLNVNAADPKSMVYYTGKTADGKIKGYTFVTSGKGYSGTIKTMVAVSPDFKILRIKVISQSETPGLGARCIEDDFAPCFDKLSINDLIVLEDGGKIQSIAGATITTRAITKSIRNGLVILKKGIEKNPKTAKPAQKVAMSGGSL